MRDSQPQVLQVSRSVIDGGFDYHAEIARGLEDRGAKVFTVFQRGKLSANKQALFPGRVVCLDATKRRLYKKPFAMALAIWRVSRGKPQDLAVCHHFTPARAVSILMSLGLVRRAVLIVHDYDYFDPADKHGRRRNRFLTKAMHGPWSVIGVSESICKNVRKHVPAVPAGRCRVVHNAIDAETLEQRRLSRGTARKVLGLEPTDFVFGTVGRLVGFKAHDDLIDAFARVQALMPRAKLIIIGRGPLESKLRHQVASAGLGDRVLIHGFLDDAARYMTAFDVFVLPSKDEPFGLVLLEAMVNRLPVLASNSGAAGEILAPSAPLFPPGDRPALGECLLQAYRQTPDDLEALGLEGYRWANERFALNRYREAYANLLDPAGSAQ